MTKDLDGDGVPDPYMLDLPEDRSGESRIVRPLVRPMTFLGACNSRLGPNVFRQSQGKLTLPVVLNQYLSEYTQLYGVFLAGTVPAITPPAVLSLALQLEFISGLTKGAVKQ